MDTDAALAVWEALADEAPDRPPTCTAGDWPGVADPDALRAQLADWLAQYANAGTRRTYAYALGLPVAWVDLIGGAPARERSAATTPAPRRPAARCTTWPGSAGARRARSTPAPPPAAT